MGLTFIDAAREISMTKLTTTLMMTKTKMTSTVVLRDATEWACRMHRNN
jgi:hypothetical protein